ncbi:hypothetical protein BJ508DRAFT_371465 [Ascobolus immersus RN42]|uniref:Uncharacterized protein n=1 Tax=Ascobolus immersus RN42 TaxID=1160509 RepID=A0A3N4IQI0_ASCIM|nr:hypothetical protein BJ508DRAFT_371465 [Ascobolus immersus RN42]
MVDPIVTPIIVGVTLHVLNKAYDHRHEKIVSAHITGDPTMDNFNALQISAENLERELKRAEKNILKLQSEIHIRTKSKEAHQKRIQAAQVSLGLLRTRARDSRLEATSFAEAHVEAAQKKYQ